MTKTTWKTPDEVCAEVRSWIEAKGMPDCYAIVGFRDEEFFKLMSQDDLVAVDAENGTRFAEVAMDMRSKHPEGMPVLVSEPSGDSLLIHPFVIAPVHQPGAPTINARGGSC